MIYDLYMTIAVISHPNCMFHEMGPMHPESPERVHAIDKALHADSKLRSHLQFYTAKPCIKQDLRRVHTPEYIEEIFASSPMEGLHCLDPDTLMNPHTLDAALLAAGAAIQAVDLVMAEANSESESNSMNSSASVASVSQAFCNIRPPGHHAEHDRAMGFCFFNNVAVAAAYAMEKYPIKRVAIMDFDVHHGNGTEDIFRNDERVMMCSSYQYPLYPGYPVITNHPRLIHSPLHSGAGGKAFRTAVTEQWLPALNRFQPDFIFISAGFDAHYKDPLANLNFKEEDYFWVTQQILSEAEKHCKGRIVSCLEGGYALDALATSVVAHLTAFID